jgi:hypothetical protein
MRLACVIVALVLAGCRPTIDYPDVYADLACETAYSVVRLREQIAPTPAPKSDKCENCDGTGKIGDGRIVMTCPVCKGTGKTPKSVLVRPACPDGKCRP